MATDQTTRLEAATVKAENGSQIVYDFANGSATANVQTASGPIPTLAGKLAEISDTLAISAGIYPTTAAGLAATNNGQVFLVYASDDDDIIYRVYQNQNGSAVDTGKSSISGTDLEQALQQASQSSQQAQQAAQQAVDAAASVTTDLSSSTDPSKGAALIGFDGGTVADVIKTAKPFLGFDAMRSYTGNATVVRVLATGIFGDFYYDPADTSSADDNGTIIVSSNGKRWKRLDRSHIWASIFGASPSATFDSSTALKAAIAYARSIGGGTIKLGRGVLRCDAELALSPVPGIGFHNVTIEGDGTMATRLDFANAPPGSNGVNLVGWGGRVNLKGFAIYNARAIGLVMNNVERGSAAYISRCAIEDVIIDGSVGDGVRCTQTYMCSFRDVESRNNGGYGFNLRGSHTSMMFSRCWAGGDAAKPQGGNTQGGWMVNGLVYSSFESCSADNNAGPGWTIKATGGVTMTSCGSEANVGAGFLAVSDDNNITAIPTPGINGLIMDGCFAVGNGSASAQTPNFLEFSSSGTRTGDIVLRGCYDLINGAGSSVSLAYVGAGGALTIEEDSCHFAGTRTKSGNVFVKNAFVQGRSAVARLSANYSAASGSNVVIPFDTFDSNRMGATFSSGGIVVPAGVNRVKVNAAVFWGDNSTGVRVLTVYKNGASFYGGPSVKVAGNGFTGQAITSSVLEVVAGDIITAVGLQTSGAALAVTANQNTFLSIEALG